MRNPFTIRNRMILAVIAVALSSVVATSQSTNNPSNGGLTVGTSAITGGTDTRILRNNAGVLGEYTISGTGTAVCMTISCVMTTPSLGVASAAALNLSGNISTPAWTTSGIRYTSTTATLTDTSSSGTVAAARTNSFGGETVAASSATTYTNYYGSYFVAPVAGTNVTLTNKPALGADSIQVAAGTTAAPSLIFGTGTTDGFYSPVPDKWRGLRARLPSLITYLLSLECRLMLQFDLAALRMSLPGLKTPAYHAMPLALFSLVRERQTLAAAR